MSQCLELGSGGLVPCLQQLEGTLESGLLGTLLEWSVTSSISLRIIEPQRRSTKSQMILAVKLILLSIALASSLGHLFLIASPRNPIRVLVSYFLEPATLLGSIVLTYYNHTRSRTSSSMLLIFWPLYSSLFVAQTLIVRESDHYLVSLKGMVVLFGLASFSLECVGPEIGLPKDENSVHESPILTANIFSRWSFRWMTSIMVKGSSLTEDDLPSLLESDESEKLGKKLEPYLTKHGVLSSLFLAYGGPFFTAIFIKLASDSLNFLQPQLLRWFLSYTSRYQKSRQDGSAPAPTEGFIIAIIMFAAAGIQTIILNQYFPRIFETGMRIRAGLVTALFSKSLVLANDKGGRSTGDIVNLMSVDAIRLQELANWGGIAISAPFQIILAFVSLYSLLGWPAFVGVGIMIMSFPLNTFIARHLKRLSKQQMEIRDQRSRLMTEILSNIKSIKLHAWESAFIRRVLSVRNDKELRMLRKMGLLMTSSSVLGNATPLFVAFASFAAVAATSSQPITSDLIFPAISVFTLLQFPLSIVSTTINNVVEGLVSARRLSDFFRATELQPDAREIILKNDLQLGDEVLTITDADFRWGSKDVVPALQNINLIVRKGELTGVMGRVGAGKTSLLAAMIGEMSRSEGKVALFGSVSYAPQDPWLLSATIRDNITFNLLYEEAFYKSVIEACALAPDLAQLSKGDLTEVGEKGELICLFVLFAPLKESRDYVVDNGHAVYARADLVLLDDCLAAVDSNVARHIFGWILALFHQVIGPQGILASQARILVTNSISFVKQFDQIAFMSRGIIRECGSYQTVMENTGGDFNNLIRDHGISASGTSTPFNPSGSATPYEDLLISAVDDKTLETPARLSEKLRHHTSYPKAVLAPPKPVRAANALGLSKEYSEQGSVKRRVYVQYIKAASKAGFIVFLLAVAGQQAMTLFGNLTLRAWGEHNREMGDNAGMAKYLLMYCLFSLSSVLLGGVSSIIMWMLISLMNAPLSFFETTPTGRTLNLFSRDVYVLDTILPRWVQMFFRMSATGLSVVIVIGANFPLFLLSIIPLGWFYLRVMKYYLATSRELKRLDAVSKSPIVGWFSESLAGVSTIRAFNQLSVFVKANQWHIDRNQICYLASISVARWLAFRLEFAGAVIILMVACLAMVSLITTGIDAGLIGLILTYTMNITSSLNWAVRSASDVEQNIVSAERILHQTEVPPEAPQYMTDAKPNHNWPSQGKIEFKNYSTRYREELGLVLKDISLEIRKIGCLRKNWGGQILPSSRAFQDNRRGEHTGLVPVMEDIPPIAISQVEGSILIDGVDIKTIGLHDLRSSISIVPQVPDMFEGTLRENIDPIAHHDDADIWVALEEAHMKEYVESIPGGLDAPVREGGQSLSSGQRQLLCFALLVLDEATSAVDLDTDKAIQDTIQGPAFTDVTVITIAHRLNTIMSGSRILVMDQGQLDTQVAELDTPQKLLANKSSIFYSLATEASLT
ncbi:hypothetical protein MVEN_00784300 [Mycena venus]|uniref:Uncharacterized protein n=1 Tax=Mycena venus TaxID=2733690 RepID=A0A8H6YIQ4_9AGAR|nr:hypothetical protein MVEN_00784300 [Mycena venus]